MSAGTGPVQVGRAVTSLRAWLVLLVTVAAGLTADLASKAWSFKNVAGQEVVLERDRLIDDPTFDPLPHHPSRVAIPHILQYRLVINRGAVFGLGADQRRFFILFTVLALIGAVYVFGQMIGPRATSGHIAVGLIVAGGLGNLHDRVCYGVVRDFLQMFPNWRLPFGWSWRGGNPELFPWVFNIADVMLLVGMVVLMVNLRRRRAELASQAETEAEIAPPAAVGRDT